MIVVEIDNLTWTVIHRSRSLTSGSVQLPQLWSFGALKRDSGITSTPIAGHSKLAHYTGATLVSVCQSTADWPLTFLTHEMSYFYRDTVEMNS